MRIDLRVIFATLVLLASACSGMSGLDSGTGGMPGEVAPPVNAQGAFGQPNGANAGGPTAGPNGVAELANPGATLAPNQAQYPVADGPSGMKCPTITLQGGVYQCVFSFNVPATPSPGASGSPKPKPTPSPTPTPEPSASPDDNGDDASDNPSPTPTPPGGITLQVEALPTDVPGMTNPDMRVLKTAAIVGIRLQSDTDFVLDGTSIANYTLPKTQFAGRSFALQLYNESFPRTAKGPKRTDTFIAGYGKAVTNADASTVNFTFTVPKLTVKRGQIWLIVLYGLTYPPNVTPGPSASPSPSPSPAPSGSSSASPSPSPASSPSASSSPHS